VGSAYGHPSSGTSDRAFAFGANSDPSGSDHDEEINSENTLLMADEIPNAELPLQPGVGHFFFLQDPEQFNSDVLHFLRHVPEP